MHLMPSETETIFCNAARSLLVDKFDPSTLRRLENSTTGFDEGLWQAIVAAGWTELVAADLEGEGLSLLAVLLRELGRAAVASPYFQAIAAGVALQRLGGNGIAKEMLSSIAAGKKAVLVAPSDHAGLPKGILTAQSIEFHGGPFFVEWAHLAELFVCPIWTEAAGWMLVALSPGHKGLSITEMRSIDNERVAAVAFDHVIADRGRVITPDGFDTQALETCLLLVRLLRAVEMSGGVELVQEMTVDYVCKRSQFGKPLGALQAVQHICADLAMESDAALLATAEAVSLASVPAAFRSRAALASFISGRAYERATQASAELHGGMGAMSEYPLQFYYRRAKGQRQRLGSIRFQLESVARHVVDVAARTGKFPTREFLVVA